MTAIMEAVVEEGTGKNARIDGYTVAGKTGTAHKVVNGAYSPSEYNASFVGFVPSRKPALTIIVVIDSPHGKGYYGGAVAAPIFKRVAEASLRHLGIAPTVNARRPCWSSRGLRRRRLWRAGRRAVNLDVTLEPAPRRIDAGPAGLSARDANRALTRIGMTGRLDGDGFVLEQSPAAGSVLVRGVSAADARTAAALPELPMTLGAPRGLLPDARRSTACGTPLTVRASAATVASVTSDSREVVAGSVFVALRGLKADGAAFTREAMARGAIAVIAETPVSADAPPAETAVPWHQVSDARLALAALSAAFFGNPSADLVLVGITGTNGKTTTSYLLASIFDAAGIRCGRIGTVGYKRRGSRS